MALIKPLDKSGNRVMSPLLSLPSFLSLRTLEPRPARTPPLGTCAQSHHHVSALAFSEKRSKRLKRRSIVDSEVFHVDRDVVFVRKRVCGPIHRRVLFDQSLAHLVQCRLWMYIVVFSQILTAAARRPHAPGRLRSRPWRISRALSFSRTRQPWCRPTPRDHRHP